MLVLAGVLITLTGLLITAYGMGKKDDGEEPGEKRTGPEN